MRFHRSLRYRVAFTFAMFGGLVSILLGTGLYYTAHDLERRLIDETLTAEMQDYLARRAHNPHSAPPATATVLGYVLPHTENEPDVPAEVQALPPGQHHLNYHGTPYRVAVMDRDTTRYFILFNETRQRLREDRFVLYLGAGVLVMILLSAMGGLWLAGQVISPVTVLAKHVRGLNLDDHPTSLAPDFPDDEVGELAQAFDHHHARLQSFIEREREFTADVSHELRTPLAIIQGASEIILSDPSLPDRCRERMARVDRAVVDATQITTALLLLAREDRAAARADKPCSVAEVLRDTVEKHRHLLQGKTARVEIELHAPVHLPTERTLLSIVLGNLIRNAFVYTERGEIRIRLDEDHVTITDSGTGIPIDELDRVFQRHYRGPNSQGEGIGLSLVRRICDYYGWSIAINSHHGQGTVAQLVFAASADLNST